MPHYSTELLHFALRQMTEASGPRRWWTAVAVKAEEVVGTVTLLRLGSQFLPDGTIYVPDANEDVGALEQLFVPEAHWNRGIGRILVDAALARAREWKLRQVRAHSTNPAAARVFQAAGLTEWGRVTSRTSADDTEFHYVVNL